MMDPKAAALKKMKVKSPMAGLNKSIPLESKAEEAKEEKEETDLAPEVGDKKPMMPAQLGEEHAPLMQSLSDGISHPGRGPKSLDERAAGNMKAILAKKKK